MAGQEEFGPHLNQNGFNFHDNDVVAIEEYAGSLREDYVITELRRSLTNGMPASLRFQVHEPKRAYGIQKQISSQLLATKTRLSPDRGNFANFFQQLSSAANDVSLKGSVPQ